MKASLNLSIDDDLLQLVKAMQKKQHISVSKLVEEYFITITKPNFVDLINELGKHNIDTNVDLKKLYYGNQKYCG